MNDESLELLARTAVSQVRAGIDIIAPSDMMDGRVGAIRRALENNELVLYYQPKIDMKSGALAGFEALLRWRHPRLGLVAPLQFIPVAEETGLILPIGAWAMEDSARQFAEWRKLLPDADLQVSVNLSVKQFFDRDLVDHQPRDEIGA